MSTTPSSPKREFPRLVDQPGGEDVQSDQRTGSGSGSSTHKRSLSGNIFSRFPILRANSSEKISTTTPDGPDEGRAAGSMSAVLQQKKSRRRKGSLRKVALLGGRDRKGSDAKTKSPLSSPGSPRETDASLVIIPDHETTPRQSRELRRSRSPPKWPVARTSVPSINSSAPSIEPMSSAASIASPTSPIEPSLTDDDEMVAFPRLPTNNVHGSSNDSYFPPLDTITKKHSTKKQSPLATQPHSGTVSPLVEEEWDYTETAYWGYVILIVTWLVFVIGMGSCFGVWSWSWDVGETPYAPPELEDDPTLPIVGYYPALMVLTAVMAWIWVLIAWIGLKYFRHADMRADD